MNTTSAQLFDGVSARANSVTLEFAPSVLRIRGSNPQEYSLPSLRVSERAGHGVRFIHLPDGRQLLCPDTPELGRIPQHERSGGVVAWLDRKWWIAVVATMLTVIGLYRAYVVALPRLAVTMAGSLSFQQEARWANQVLSELDKSGLFQKTRLTGQQLDELNSVFWRVAAKQNSGSVIRLEARAAPALGANAAALPGAVIVVTDDLVKLSENQEQLASVIAHEFGHVERRHTLRHVIQDAGILALLTVVSDSVQSVIVLGALPSLLASRKYSREMEVEADTFALNWLKSEGIDSTHFARMLELLSVQRQEQGKGESLSYVATHPDIKSRIERARAAAR